MITNTIRLLAGIIGYIRLKVRVHGRSVVADNDVLWLILEPLGAFHKDSPEAMSFCWELIDDPTLLDVEVARLLISELGLDSIDGLFCEDLKPRDRMRLSLRLYAQSEAARKRSGLDTLYE